MKSRDETGKGWWYGEMEEALVRLYSISDADRGAFRARIRHLRNLSIPPIPKVGRGRQAIYEIAMIEELFFALEITKATVPPSVVASFINVMRIAGRRLSGEGALPWIVVAFDAFHGTEKDSAAVQLQSVPESQLDELVRQYGRIGAVLVLNFEKRVRDLHVALEQIAPAH